MRRAEDAGNVQKKVLGEAMRNWGVPTGASVALLSPLGFDTVIATGGVASGLDACRAFALGASLGVDIYGPDPDDEDRVEVVEADS